MRPVKSGLDYLSGALVAVATILVVFAALYSAPHLTRLLFDAPRIIVTVCNPVDQ